MEPLLHTTEGREVAPPAYRSFKEVWALKIIDIESHADGSVTLSLEAPFKPVTIEPKVVHRYMPIAGDYFILYRDGYRSISPRNAFETGYERI